VTVNEPVNTNEPLITWEPDQLLEPVVANDDVLLLIDCVYDNTEALNKFNDEVVAKIDAVNRLVDALKAFSDAVDACNEAVTKPNNDCVTKLIAADALNTSKLSNRSFVDAVNAFIWTLLAL